jgi:hypothetical protein
LTSIKASLGRCRINGAVSCNESEAEAMSLKRIRIELARDPEFPEGSSRHGYEFILPLDHEGRLDRSGWGRAALVCTVHRFWAGEEPHVGHIVHSARGKWLFSFGEHDHEPIHRLEDHAFRQGEYLSVREPDGRTRTFRIVQVGSVSGLAA